MKDQSALALSDKVATELGGAFARLAELKTKSILESTDANERRALEKFVADTLTEHGVELLGCWFTVRNRYRPLVQGFVSLIEAADSILARKRQAEPKLEGKLVPEEGPGLTVNTEK